MTDDRSGESFSRTAEIATAPLGGHVPGAFSPPALPVGNALDMDLSELKPGQPPANDSGEGRTVLWGRRRIKVPSIDGRPEFEEDFRWIATWLRALLVAFVRAVIVLALAFGTMVLGSFVFGGIWRFLTLVWNLAVKVLAIAGISIS